MRKLVAIAPLSSIRSSSLYDNLPYGKRWKNGHYCRMQSYRIGAGCSLLCSFVLFTLFIFHMLWRAENDAYLSHYDAMSTELLHGFDTALDKLHHGCASMATSLSLINPDSSVWPNASISGYGDLNNNVDGLTNTRVTLSPIVWPEKASYFESYAAQAFASSPDTPAHAGYSPFGFGIFALDENGTRYHDKTGVTSFSNNTFMTPILGSAFPATSKAFLYNTHSELTRGSAMDSVYACVLAGAQQCSALSDVIQHISTDQYNPTSLLFVPIFAHNDKALVGFSTLSFTWMSSLEDTLSELVNDVECVVSTSTHQYTISVQHGLLRLKGKGDLHNKNYDRHRKSTVVSLNTQVDHSVAYSAEVYPTDSLYDAFHSDTPIVATTSCLALVLFSMAIYACYDNLIRREHKQKDQLLIHKRQFVRFVSHEIRTPLNAVLLGLRFLVEVLQDAAAKEGGGREEEYLTHSQEITKNANVAVTVLNEFLQFDKIEAGQLSLDVKPVPLVETIRDNVKLLMLQASECRVRLVLKNDKQQEDALSDCTGHFFGSCREYDDLYVMGDSLRLGQVVRNLVSNSLKFSAPESTVEILVTASMYGLPGSVALRDDCTVTQPAGSLTFSVTDRGPGLSVENVSKLFGEGVQFNPNELQAGHGSGLGLWISKGIVDLHGGKIWASSPGEGEGCTFSVELPVVKCAALTGNLRKVVSKDIVVCGVDTAGTEERLEKSVDQIGAEDTRGVVLIVDDAASNRKVVSRLLQRRGYSTMEACDGLEAVNIMKSFPLNDTGIACILMDFEMPVVSDFSV